MYQQQQSGYITHPQVNYKNKEGVVGTILGLLLFAPFVVFAYRLNTYFLKGQPMTGGRFFWRQLGWSILCMIPFFGLIYGLMNIGNIRNARAKIRALPPDLFQKL